MTSRTDARKGLLAHRRLPGTEHAERRSRQDDHRHRRSPKSNTFRAAAPHAVPRRSGNETPFSAGWFRIASLPLPNGTRQLTSPRLRSMAVRYAYGGFISGRPAMKVELTGKF